MNKAELDEMNFRYNSLEANRQHVYVKETNYYKLPALDYTPCRICGRRESSSYHMVDK
jgi:hypothetical protein